MKYIICFYKYIISQYLAIPRIFTDKKQGLSYPPNTHNKRMLYYCIMVKRVFGPLDQIFRSWATHGQ